MDIVKRLRNFVCPDYVVSTTRDAANEIEMLRAALQHYACGCAVKCGHGVPTDMCGSIAREALGEGWGGLTGPVAVEDKWDNE